MVKTIIEIDLPPKGTAREIYRCHDPQLVVVLRDNGDIILTRYESRKDGNRHKPMDHHSKKILEMRILK